MPPAIPLFEAVAIKIAVSEWLPPQLSLAPGLRGHIGFGHFRVNFDFGIAGVEILVTQVARAYKHEHLELIESQPDVAHITIIICQKPRKGIRIAVYQR